MGNRSEALLEIGKIVGTHGLRGDLKVRPSSGDPELLLTIDQLTLRLSSGELLVAVPSRQVLHKGQVLLRLQGFETLNDVAELVGGQVLLAEDLLPELDEDEYYWGDLQGLRVVDRQRGDIGCLEQMFSTAAHDTYVVIGNFGEVLIPAVGQFILEIDLERRVMTVDLPEGLVPEEP